MAENPSEKKQSYVARLLSEAEMSVVDILIDLGASLGMTAALLAIRVAGSSEKKELILSAIIYSIVFFILALIIHVLIKAPYKIIKKMLNTPVPKKGKRN